VQFGADTHVEASLVSDLRSGTLCGTEAEIVIHGIVKIVHELCGGRSLIRDHGTYALHPAEEQAIGF